jgi:hypothetical protein
MTLQSVGYRVKLFAAISVLSISGLAVVYLATQPGKPVPETTIADFKSERDLLLIKTRDARIELSPSRLTSGKQSLVIIFSGGVNLSSILIDAPFYDSPNASDWNRFNTLQLTLYSESPNAERLILQIKDKEGKRFKQDFYLPVRSPKNLEIPVAEVATYIDIRNISDLTLFRWNAEESLTVQIDAIKLLRLQSQK